MCSHRRQETDAAGPKDAGGVHPFRPARDVWKQGAFQFFLEISHISVLKSQCIHMKTCFALSRNKICVGKY